MMYKKKHAIKEFKEKDDYEFVEAISHNSDKVKNLKKKR